MDIRRDELPLALLMFGYFFLVIASFWILKPIKKALFIQYYDQSGFSLMNWHMQASQAELLAKVLNMVVAFGAVALFTWLSRRYRRHQLTYIFSIGFMVGYAIYSFLMQAPGTVTVWSFYLFGDLFSTLMVATFFAFLNDSVTPEAAKRLYGLVGLGGVMGGVFGSTFVRVWIDIFDKSTWMWTCTGIAVLIIIIARMAGARVSKSAPLEIPLPPPAKKELKAGNPAIEGARLVFKSRYLLSIVGIVGIYEIISTMMDFQFTATIAHYLDGPDIGRQFSMVFAITNWVSMLVQFLLTSFIMTRFGLTAALMILPIACLIASAGFLAVPVLWMGSMLNTADNGFSYSINQSAKETLYTPTTKDEKYKAKAFIDMFIQRFAKALAVGLSLLITLLFADFSSLRFLSLATIALVIVWIMVVRYTGRAFLRKTTTQT